MPTIPQAAHKGRLAAEAKYRELRRAAFHDAASALSAAGVDAEFRPIDAAALAAAERWRNRRVGWPWHLMIPDWRRNYPERFEVAIWQGGVLRARSTNRIELLGRTGPKPLFDPASLSACRRTYLPTMP